MLEDEIKKISYDNVATIPVSEIVFDSSLVKLCEMNSCGLYKKSYTCPPYVGKPEELMKKAQKYKSAIVFQKIYPLEDSFDFEGMCASKENFQQLTKQVFDICEKENNDYLLLGAGSCILCKTCAINDNLPCRFPGKAIASLESYCILVSSLAEKCGMKYINGQNTVTYFGAVLCE